MPVFFSVTRMSLGPTKAIVVGAFKPLATFTTVRFGSLTVGPVGNAGAFTYAPYERCTGETTDIDSTPKKNITKVNEIFIRFEEESININRLNLY